MRVSVERQRRIEEDFSFCQDEAGEGLVVEHAVVSEGSRPVVVRQHVS